MSTDEARVGTMPGSAMGRRGERGIALVVVLLLLATTTFIGLGAMSSAISDMRIASNENCMNRVLNASEVGIEDGMAGVYALDDEGARYNTGNAVYNTNPVSYWNVVKNAAGDGNCGDMAPKATDAEAECTESNLASLGASPDGIVQAASEEGGQFSYFYEIRLINPSIGAREGVGCGKAAVGEQIAQGSGIRCRDYVVHSLGAGCAVTQDLNDRVTKTERNLGTQDYST